MNLVLVTCLLSTLAGSWAERRWHYGPPPVTHHHNDHKHEYNETHHHLHQQEHQVNIHLMSGIKAFIMEGKLYIYFEPLSHDYLSNE